MLSCIHNSSSFFPPFPLSRQPSVSIFIWYLSQNSIPVILSYKWYFWDCWLTVPGMDVKNPWPVSFLIFLKLTWTTYTWRNWMHISKMFLSVVCYFQTCCHWWLQLWFLKRRRCMSTSEMFENVAQYFQMECGNNKIWNSHLQGVLRCMI